MTLSKCDTVLNIYLEKFLRSLRRCDTAVSRLIDRVRDLHSCVAIVGHRWIFGCRRHRLDCVDYEHPQDLWKIAVQSMSRKKTPRNAQKFQSLKFKSAATIDQGTVWKALLVCHSYESALHLRVAQC